MNRCRENNKDPTEWRTRERSKMGYLHDSWEIIVLGEDFSVARDETLQILHHGVVEEEPVGRLLQVATRLANIPGHADAHGRHQGTGLVTNILLLSSNVIESKKTTKEERSVAT